MSWSNRIPPQPAAYNKFHPPQPAAGDLTLQKTMEDFNTPVENAVHMRDGGTIVGHGHILFFCTFQSMAHLLLVEHAAAAVNDQAIRVKVFREFGSAGKLKMKLFSGILSDPSG